MMMSKETLSAMFRSRCVWKRITIDGSHDETNLGGICGAGEMRVDLLRLRLIERYEAVENVIACRSIVVTTLVVREVVLHRAYGKLFPESINLVQEENDTGLDEPSRVANRVEECQRLLHTVDGLVFEQKLIVLRDGHEEENGGNILETVDPLLSF